MFLYALECLVVLWAKGWRWTSKHMISYQFFKKKESYSFEISAWFADHSDIEAVSAFSAVISDRYRRWEKPIFERTTRDESDSDADHSHYVTYFAGRCECECICKSV